MSDGDRTTTGRGVLVAAAILAALLILFIGAGVLDSALSYIGIGD